MTHDEKLRLSTIEVGCRRYWHMSCREFRRSFRALSRSWRMTDGKPRDLVPEHHDDYYLWLQGKELMHHLRQFRLLDIAHVGYDNMELYLLERDGFFEETEYTLIIFHTHFEDDTLSSILSLISVANHLWHLSKFESRSECDMPLLNSHSEKVVFRIDRLAKDFVEMFMETKAWSYFMGDHVSEVD